VIRAGRRIGWVVAKFGHADGLVAEVRIARAAERVSPGIAGHTVNLALPAKRRLVSPVDHRDLWRIVDVNVGAGFGGSACLSLDGSCRRSHGG
jgi:hypothetical protein